MATDATGTPTSPDSIPTYNTSADAPSGLGFNAAMAAIQTALSARWIKSMFTTAGDIAYATGASTPARLGIGSTGQVLTVVGGLPAWGGGAGTTPATTLPGSPVDGQQAVLVDSTSAPTYAWLMQWSTAASKWIYLGGSSAEAEVATSENIASTSYVDAATVGPSVTAPRAGSYLVTFGAQVVADINVNIARYVSPKIGAAATSDNDAAILSTQGGSTNEFVWNTVSRTVRKTLAASDVIKLQYRGSAAGSQAVANRWLSLTPVTVT